MSPTIHNGLSLGDEYFEGLEEKLGKRPQPVQRGDLVNVRVFGGGTSQRRVWANDGDGVQVCSEDDWDRWEDMGIEPLWVGWPPEDVLGVAKRVEEGQP